MRHIKVFLFIALIGFVTFEKTSFSQSMEYQGKVVSVHDGDTLTLLLNDHTSLKIRLAEIDAPETGQPFGQKSKKLLSDFVFGRNVKVKQIAIDRYGRTVGRVYSKDVYVNLEMAKLGGAWAYTKYLQDNQIKIAEEKARISKLGLWSSNEEPIPPWIWRKQSKSNTKSASPNIVFNEVHTSSKFACEGKTRCKQMSSCEEAKFYLENCGADKIDGDKDGKPCEALCQ